MRVAVLIGFTVITLLAGLPVEAATRFALVIGNNVGGIDDGALRWAEEDAQRVHQLLIELGKVASGRASLIKQASADRVRKSLIRLGGQVEEARRQGYRTEVFLFYSGHGDAQSLHLGQERLPIAELKRLLAEIPADTTVMIIDACRAGAVRQKGASHGPAFDISLARDPGPTGRVLITSAGANEIAQESDDLQGSYFTHHLISGLRGAADRDADGQVTLAELYRYAYYHTLSSSHGETAAVQHPEMEVDLEGEGEIVVSLLAQAGSTLVLPRGMAGDFLVVDDRSGRVVAEVRKPEREERQLALPAGRYRIQQRNRGRILAGEVALEWGGRRQLEADSLTEQPLVSALTKGSDLDPMSWSLQTWGLAGSPIVLGRGATYGAGLGMEHTLAKLPLLVLARLQFTRAEAANEAWTYEHLETRLSLGLGYHYNLGPVRLALTLSAGLLVLRENARRIDPERVGLVSGADLKQAGTAFSPLVAPGLSLKVPILDWLALVSVFEVQTAMVKVAGDWQSATGMMGFLGADFQF